MQMSTVESVKKKPKVSRVLLVLCCVIILVSWGLYAYTEHCEKSVYRGDPDHIVDDSIAKIIGHNYISSRCVTRE